MTPHPAARIRPAEKADLAAIRLLIETAFGTRYDPVEPEHIWTLFPVDRALVAEVDGRLVAHSQTGPMTVTVPGGQLPAIGISGVAVAAPQRRRGLLRALYSEQHRQFAAEGIPLAALTASEGGIYGRFGYGAAAREHRIRLDRRFARFLPTAPDPGGVYQVSVPEAEPEIRRIYDTWRRVTPGAQERPDAAWALAFADAPRLRNGGGDLFAFLHPDGYALYRHHDDQSIEIKELRTLTADAHAALWRALCGRDLSHDLVAPVTGDDPLPYLLVDPRQVRTVAGYDTLWLRIMDIPAALTARRYDADLETVVAVDDPFLDAGGAFALRIRDGVAECAPTAAEPELSMGLDVLGAIYLGAHPARAFAAAGRLRGAPERVRALERAFAWRRDAVLGWGF
ncbi:GNAT family N-acetyltransferase [Nocardia harenae]|uniref:GNAT family N-acetyltransferase n=1 Tax=Nocardia harenae TaxID=358707 RepID=UPI000834447B|nr:GNAT family N-acetyltransferase [Nocardia harenae]